MALGWCMNVKIDCSVNIGCKCYLFSIPSWVICWVGQSTIFKSNIQTNLMNYYSSLTFWADSLLTYLLQAINSKQSCQIWPYSWSDMYQMGQIAVGAMMLNFELPTKGRRNGSCFSTFWLPEPNCTEIWSYNLPDLSHLMPIWPTLAKYGTPGYKQDEYSM